MTTKRNDGGPAYPRPMGWNGLGHHEEHESNEAQAGMSLRDYFAAKAMQGVLASMAVEAAAIAAVENAAESRMSFNAFVAQDAYAKADAMLVEREKPKMIAAQDDAPADDSEG